MLQPLLRAFRHVHTCEVAFRASIALKSRASCPKTVQIQLPLRREMQLENALAVHQGFFKLHVRQALQGLLQRMQCCAGRQQVIHAV